MSDKYSNRSGIVKIIFLVVGIIFVGRLSMLQIFDKEYKEKAKNQSLRNITQYPARGLMYDRNGQLLVYNEAVYDLMVIPRMVKNLDTNYFCQSLGITREDFEDRMHKAYVYSPYSASIFMKFPQPMSNFYYVISRDIINYPSYFCRSPTNSIA